MADRRAELEKKRLKLQQLREEKERRKREKINQEGEERDGHPRSAKDLEEVDIILKSVGIIPPQSGERILYPFS